MPHPRHLPSITLTRRRLLGTLGAALAGLPAGWTSFESSSPALAQADPIRVLGTRPEWTDAISTIFDTFSQKFGVPVELETVTFSELSTALQIAFQGGTPPDVAAFLEGTGLREARDSGLIVDLAASIPTDQLLPSVMEQMAFAGGVWGVPLASYTWGIFYRKSALANASVSPPHTWDELYSVCGQLLSTNQTPILMPGAEGIVPYFLYMLAASSSLGAEGWRQLLSGERHLDDGDLLASAELLTQLIPYFNPDFLSLDFATGRLQFLKGTGAMTIGSSMDFTRLANPSQVQGDDDLGFMPFPSPDGTLPAATVSGVDSLYAVTTTRARSEAIDLLAWLVQTEAQQVVTDQLALPVNTQTSSTTDSLSNDIIGTRQGVVDLPVWYAIPATANTYGVARSLLPSLLQGGANATDFAAGMQASIITNPSQL